MAKYAQGFFEIQNPSKYIGHTKPRYRSGWEFTFMTFCDNNSSVLKWASESIRIPYRHPLTGKITTYVPDFFIVYENKFGLQKVEIVEIKPKKQSLIESRKASAGERAVVAVNHAKWAAATAYCKSQGITFRVITEDDLFHTGKRK
jgi:hypothetical protein